MKVEPYLFFDGRCEEAIELYRRVLGAQVQMLMRYKESPEPPPPGMVPPDWGDKVMHASVRIGDSVVMFSDGKTESPGFRGFALSVTLPDAATAKKSFEALAEGGKVSMPLGKTFFAPLFGMATDRFGVLWMILQAE